MADKPWYADSYRRNLVDMHIDDWSGEFLSKFDPQHYYDCLKTAKIQSPMIYLHSHVGLCNWDSCSGVTHKAFKENNKIKKLIDLCHEGGMSVIGYYSLIYNNKEYDRHPEWRMLNAEGNPSRSKTAHGFMTGSRYGLLCPNNMEYREFLKKQFSELLGIYTIEGIFLDMTFWPMVCYCKNCQERFQKETGGPIPKVVDWRDPLWLRFQQSRESWLGEFADYCSDEIYRLQPGISIEHQFSTIHQHWQLGVTERINGASDYAGGDLYGGHCQESFICKMYYETTRNQPFEYMTSRCDPELNVHTTTKSLDVLRLHNLLTLAHHGAMLFIDAIDPVGTMDMHVYEDIGKVYSESIPYEKYLKGCLYSEAALYFDLKSKYNACARPETAKNDFSVPQLDAALGASIALNMDNIPHTVIPGGRRDKIKDKKAVAVSEAASLSDEEIRDLVSYVENGGGLYIGGVTNPKLANALLGLEYEGMTEENITYISPTEKGADIFGGRYSVDYPLSYMGAQVKVKNPKNHGVLATITLPYTNPADTSVLASIHSNPPGIRTDYPSLICGGYGKGSVLWSASAFEKNAQKSHKKTWLNAFRLLYGDARRIESDAPDFVQFTLFDDTTDKCMYLNIVNLQEIEDILPIPAFICSLDLPYDIAYVESLPEERKTDIAAKNNRVEFRVDRLDIFRMYRIKYK